MADEREVAARAGWPELVALMARLRGPEGCPWDREQDHRSLRPCLLEETYEVLEAVDAGDPEALRQELGDLLLQVIFHAQLAAEAGHFDLADVVQGLHDKLVERHPHVFGDKLIATADGVVEEWESLKREQRGQTPAAQMADVPRGLPALARAQMVLRRAARVAPPSTPEQARAEGARWLREVKTGDATSEEALGRLLLAVADLARALNLDAEQALREQVDRLLGEMRGA